MAGVVASPKALVSGASTAGAARKGGMPTDRGATLLPAYTLFAKRCGKLADLFVVVGRFQEVERHREVAGLDLIISKFEGVSECAIMGESTGPCRLDTSSRTNC
jgi:hypothetical protein